MVVEVEVEGVRGVSSLLGQTGNIPWSIKHEDAQMLIESLVSFFNGGLKSNLQCSQESN